MDLTDRGRALENAFFQDLNQQLVDKMKAEEARSQTMAELSSATGITDDATLARLADAGLSVSTLAALVCVPLIQVAYADGSLESKERDAVMRAAEAAGIAAESPAAALLDSWLAKGPSETLFNGWTAYLQGIKHHMTDAAWIAMRDRVMGNCHKVAQASGGFMGMGSESGSEKSVIAKVEQAFA